MNVYYIFVTPIAKRDCFRFGINILEARGLNPKLIDLSPFKNPAYQISAEDKLQSDQILQLRTQEEFIRFLKGMDKSTSIIIDPWNQYDSPINKLYERYGISYATLFVNAIPKINKFSYTKIFLRQIQNIFYGVFAKKNFLKYVFVGALANKDRIFAGNNAEIIWMHAMDYDLYLKYQNSKKEDMLNYTYAVFLDEYFPYHPDLNIKGVEKSPFKKPAQYYSEVNTFFEYLEKKLGIPIVIAAHPRSNYEQSPDLYNGRKIIKGKTLELTVKAEYILSHGSTAVNYAVLFKKPLIFFIHTFMRRNYFGNLSRSFAKSFNKISYDINTIKDVNWEKELQVDANLYAKYKENYIKRANTSEKYSWEIIADVLTRGKQ